MLRSLEGLGEDLCKAISTMSLIPFFILRLLDASRLDTQLINCEEMLLQDRASSVSAMSACSKLIRLGFSAL